ncbi:redoxin domain-containing protein [Tenuibacillus multivorans]|uniref:Peroxiredoxin n=1 Tax=Tenuibacillus multivorans TaxID=237069 RepID=A0A1H0CI75_9BACI|nr:redoxin domain-containing protein [Tenuibacillus multivorans]GEL76286.1 thiol:disulfide interchange protein tlpA [Tenuibacillus multivorans]SDN57580.1 Peroxiredoxin [Tenuibacillus multivorans]
MLWKRLIALGIILSLISIIVFNTMTAEEDQAERDGAVFVTPEGSDVDTSGIKVGEVAPNFKLTTLDGETVQLSDFRGKKVFINFWATWCAPCKAEMPHMQDFYEQYSDEVEVIAVNATGQERNKNDVETFVKDYGLTFPIPLDETTEVTAMYQAVSFPTTFFINTEGDVQLQRKVGPMTFEEMEKKMNQLD